MSFDSAGDHKITVWCSGQKVKGCPYTVRVYDSSRVVVSNMPTSGVLGQPVVFDSKSIISFYINCLPLYSCNSAQVTSLAFL